VTAAQPTILATCGGLNAGEWTDASYGPLLHHAIALARVRDRPARVCHINTAGGDQRFVEGQEIEAARDAGAEASHLRFFPRRNVDDLEGYLLSHDVIWVSGGSLVNLLAVWRAHGMPELLHRAWQAGVVLAGGSAGALCWHEGGTTASFGPEISAVADGLGFVSGSLAVHYDSDPKRRSRHHRAIASGELPGGYAIDEGVGLVYEGQRVVDIVAEAENRRAWVVRRDADGGVVETALSPRLLAA
jgi:peptidase E